MPGEVRTLLPEGQRDLSGSPPEPLFLHLTFSLIFPPTDLLAIWIPLLLPSPKH